MSETHAQSVSYVRETMLSEQEPPVTERGVIKWIRENLFSGWVNILLTVISLFVIYWALALVLPWAFGGVWNAGSLTECREVLFSFYKDSHDGACWAVIEDRWLQILFGFYPPELYWRPILAFVLFFVALAPVLFAERVPGQLIWFTVVYPFLATWLIWGGAVWTPILALLGFVAAFVAYKILSKVSGPIVANLGALVAALVWWGALMGPIDDSLNRMVGAGRLEDTVASLNQQAEDLPVQIAALEADAEAKASEIAAAVETKNALLVEMTEIRIEEFAIDQQIEPKEDAVQLLNGAEESIGQIEDILSEWGGVPEAASDSEADLADAEAAAASIDGLIADVNKFLGDALNDIESNTADPADVAALLAAGATQADASITEDIDALVAKSDLTDSLGDLIDLATGLTADASASDLAALRADIATASALVQSDVDTLDGIKDKIIAANASDLEAPQAALVANMAQLTQLRDEATTIAQDNFRISSQQTENRGFLTALNSLTERENSLPELRATTQELRDAVPSAYRNMIDVNQLPEDATSEDAAALNAYLGARNQELSVGASIRDTYAELGRVGLRPIDSRQIGGFMLALIIGIAGIVLSLPLGILLALGRQSHLFFVNKICVAFIEVIRGVPLIVWLFTASLLLNYFLPPGTNFDLMLRVIIMVTLFSAAYIAEVIRGGLAALPTGQYEGADSLGLSYWQSMQLIVLPQALKISIPGIVNTFIGLFKDTVLVVFIGLLDPIGLSNAIRADTDWNGIYWELFVFIGALFFIFCFGMGRYSLYLERKLQREHR
ncbi:Inner membrane amino-acid ABC transporter permease protein YhdY [Pseudooctadecabacter jejudonensis]|uniref:Inner membrane amino-acid ABC transporter permease protein YhdY n=1 Tax=Pseudooctadecabacter jejudonensis TaxID=1391910 RepID=A0A1Y5RY36_9RHOB|nr:Inner membrane amino-acid ABC transporter permease protein YhdY [Pseudooctadecabacter jejudonensis]